MTVATAPSAAVATHRQALEAARRLSALQVDTVAHAVTGLADEVGWARLTELGTAATVRAQESGVAATIDLLSATLDAAGLAGDIASLPGIEPGWLRSGRDVRGMFAVTRGIVQARMGAGAEFAEALDASATVLTAVASSEPHRIARDGQFNTGLADDRFGRYRRVAVGDSCPFCLMLATRGAVYLTVESAGRGKQFHYHCDCYVELVADPAAIESSRGLSGDWRNAIRDDRKLTNAGQRNRWDNLSDAQVYDLARRSNGAPSAELSAEVARRRAASPSAARSTTASTAPVARDIRDVVTVTKPNAQEVAAIAGERDLLTAKRQFYRDRIAESRASQAARKVELARQFDTATPAELNRIARRDYSIRREQKAINNALKWDRHLSDKIGVQEKLLADLEFDLPSSPMASWRVGEAMPIDDAAKGANPQYLTNKKATVNCGRVVQTVEMRRRGVDVVAKPMEKMRGTLDEIIERAWVDSDGVHRKFRQNMAGYTVLDVIEKTWPPGARGIVLGSWRRGGSHVWNVEKLADGTIRFIEGQSGRGAFAPSEYINRMKLSGFGILRVDDMQPTQRMLDAMEAAG